MNMKIFSRFSAETSTIVKDNCQEPFVWISIGNPIDQGRDEPKPIQNKFCKGILSLFFHDVEVEEDGYIFFSDTHAKQIVDFIKQSRDAVSLVCVHCEAGVSRSAGVAISLAQWLNNDDMGIGPQNNYWPNTLVKKKMEEAIKNSLPK